MSNTSVAPPRNNSKSRLERLAQFFREHPHQRYDGARELATIGGRYAWRSRISDLRRSPYGYQIDNRQRAMKRIDGTGYTVSRGPLRANGVEQEREDRDGRANARQRVK